MRPFETPTTYFRDALVRANYRNRAVRAKFNRTYLGVSKRPCTKHRGDLTGTSCCAARCSTIRRRYAMQALATPAKCAPTLPKS